MTLDRAVMAFAGCIVLVSLALAYLFSPYWLLLTTFVGLNLIQASFTGFCPAAVVFKQLGVGQGAALSGRRPRLDLDHGGGREQGA